MRLLCSYIYFFGFLVLSQGFEHSLEYTKLYPLLKVMVVSLKGGISILVNIFPQCSRLQ